MIMTSIQDAGGLPRVQFDRPEGPFSPVYLPDPPGNFASLNAGDLLLYVGGGAINKAFEDALWRAGQTPNRRYTVLHEALLNAASANPGELAWLPPGAVEPWYMNDSLAMVGSVPPDKEFESLKPVGLVSITVFPKGKRPCQSDRNVAMVYAVGPNARRAWKQDAMSLESFLLVLEKIGANIASAVRQYNRSIDEAIAREEAGEEFMEEPERETMPEVRKVDPKDWYKTPMTYDECARFCEGKYSPEQTDSYWHRHCKLHVPAGERAFCRPPRGLALSLPRIEVLRVALLSGGGYMHPDAKKEDVAAALIKGLVAHGSGPTMPLLDFAFDENAFGKAWTALGLSTWHFGSGSDAQR